MAGKSTLAYACCRAGWTYVSDDGTFLVRSRSDRYAVGDFSNVRLREDAVRFFPELANRLPVVRPNGKVALEIRTNELPIRTLPGHTIDHVVFLERQDSGRATIRRYSPDQAVAEWEQFASFGTDDVRAAQKRCHRSLMRAGVWAMRYADLADAIERLERLVHAGF